MNRPVVFDLFCGLGGWSAPFIAHGYRAVGFDLEAMRRKSSKSNARKAASAIISKIPPALADWIAKVFKPQQKAVD